MGIETVQQITRIGVGNGYMQVGESALTLQDVGALEGNSVETVTREVVQITDGQPQLVIHEEVIREMARITATLKEKNLKMLARQLGYSATTGLDVTRIVQTDVVVSGERKILYDQTWSHTYGANIKSSPAPVVTTDDSTPATLEEGVDYCFDSKRRAIRRIEGGSIASGNTIIMSYTYTRGSTTGIHMGGLATKQYFRVRFVYNQTDGGRQITEYAKAFPAPETVQSYNSGAVNTREIAWDAAADFTLDEGQRIRQQWFEDVAVVV